MSPCFHQPTAGVPSLSDFPMVWQLRIAPVVAKTIAHLPPAVKHEVKRAFRTLSADPHAGEPLERELKGLWKYRTRAFRVVYRMVADQRILHVVAVGHRRTIYDLILRQRQGEVS